ncbi:multidrug ABC transporter ATP-binding protein [Caldicellulosiruptor diazotrophicus]|uniref:Multidrug ABC transporter ATP-binding protein n=1 Tax=Caldicellulosiruptor diazotrophicus TaxID=2806205 RepID=A0ABM7NQ89_9FIRM|nr:ABC transporter ATP-binding protein [Caldicellulosiruptor diazotrophicus]BCS82334.1 multidrug ABC transporter ATP-binding protein [Caldicellulosiruptor diazotrophicus]
MPDKKHQSSFQPPVFGPGPVPGRGPGHRFSNKGSKPKDLKVTLKRLWGYFKEFKLLLLVIFLTITIGAILQIISPLLIQQAIDNYIIPRRLSGLYKIILGMIGIYIVNSIFAYLQGYGMMVISQKVVFKMRNDLFSKLQKLPIKIFDTKSHGDLMSRLTNDIDVVTNTLNASLTSIFSSIITIVGSIVVMLLLSPVLTVLTLTVVPLMFWLTNLIASRTRKLFSQNQKLLGSLNGIIEEDITGQKVIKVFTREEKEIKKFEKVNKELTQVGIKAQIFSGIIPPLMNLLNNLAFIIVAASGGFLALKGFITVGTIASFIQYARQFTRPLNDLANQFNQIQSAFAAAERVFEIMDEQEEMSSEDEVELKDIKGEVEFRNVWFSYTKGQPVIKNISFKVKPGQMVALVGPTGSGKTTIVNLLSRFYDVDSGQILIDGIDIRKINRHSLRKKLGIVLQDTFLFSEPVKENIRYGKLSATDDEVILASKMANAHDFVKHLPHGYNTVLTDNGMDLSQGQRQLLAIARAILSDPAILILDEATSNIDTRTEKLVQSAMLKLMQGRTSFVIAHRLSTIRNADLILVIYNGEIIEQGTHEDLLAKKGFYYNLYMSQFVVV